LESAVRHTTLSASALFLLLLLACPLLNAIRVRDLPASRNGQMVEGVPQVCETQFLVVAFIAPGWVGGPITFDGQDSMGQPFTVTITPSNFGTWQCLNGQARPSTFGQTVLLVEVTGSGNPLPTLRSLTVASSLPLADFFYFDFTLPQFSSAGTSSPQLVDQFQSFVAVAQPAPAAGADGVNTVYSFGLIHDVDTGLTLGTQTLDYTGCLDPPSACGSAVAVSANGYGGQIALPVSASGYGVSVVDSRGHVISLGLTTPRGTSVSQHYLPINAIPITNQSSPTLYDVSTNYPLEAPNGTQTFPSGLNVNSFPVPTPCYTAPAPAAAYRSVWFDYTPQADSTETFTTFGSHYDTMVGVYIGDPHDPQDLTLIQDNGNYICNDNLDDNHVQSQVTWQAMAGNVYHILVTEFPPLSTSWYPPNQQSPDYGEIVITGASGGTQFPYTCATTSKLCASPLSSDSTLYVQLTNQQQLLPYYADAQSANPQPPIGSVSASDNVRPPYTGEPPTKLYASEPAQFVNVASPNAVAVNAANNTAIVASAEQGKVTVISGTNSTTISDSGAPMAVAANSVTNKVYVANALSNSVTVIDGVTLATSTVNTGGFPAAVAVNQLTNKTYVVNQLGDSVTVIDGATLATTTVPVGVLPGALAINQITNKIYVVDACNTTACNQHGAVTVIDGSTNMTRSVDVGTQPGGIAVNSATNMVYVTNQQDNTVTAINGATLATSTINVGLAPFAIGVNGVTNKIYVANENAGSVSVINGATNQTQTTIFNVGSNAYALVIDEVTNKIYVANCDGDNTCSTPGAVTVISGTVDGIQTVAIVGVQPVAIALNSSTHNLYVADLGTQNNSPDPGNVAIINGNPPAALQFVNLTPCRLVDTRNGNGPIAGGTSQSFVLPGAGGCGVPQNAAAVSLNTTVVPQGRLGYLSLWPTGEDQPLVSTLNSPDGRVKANAAIVPAGYLGAVSVYVTDTTNVILDVDGYFIPPNQNTLQFYPLAPCRLVDTRNGQQQGTLQAGVERDYTLAGHCGIPSSAAAFSLNVTVLPVGGGLDYLTVWPKGVARPTVSTLNDPTGTSVANAAIVPIGNQNATAFYAHNNNTDLLVDTNGYFAPQGSGLSFYPAAPCRVLDTRHVGNGQPFVGTLSPPVNVAGSPCAPPSNSRGYVFNATVVPANGPMPFLTLWPDGQGQPTVSTLNARDGAITSNLAIVPTSNGMIDAYAQGLTQLILDISGYFAP
jgi:YVTN family beta-propeller protein